MSISNLKKIEKLRTKTEKDIADTKLTLKKENQLIDGHLSMVKDEYLRVTEISKNADDTIEQIDRDFQESTKLNSTDVIFLFVATALQCVRQYLLPSLDKRISATDGDNMMENLLSDIPPKWKDVLFQSVPYDAILTSEHVEETGLSGITHRYRTLGHDPLLGLVFGTANIMTNSLTKYDFESFQVRNMTIVRHYPNGTIGMLQNAIERGCSDNKLLIAALARQVIHIGSDFFTKQGLPIPGICVMNNDLAKDMITKWHLDSWNLVKGTTTAALINQIIFILHFFFYDTERDGNKSLYEVKTRKVLSYSNILATSSNILVSTFTQDYSKLDIGGIVVTLYRIISDYKFISSIKKEFLEKELYRQITGEKYDFVEE